MGRGTAVGVLAGLILGFSAAVPAAAPATPVQSGAVTPLAASNYSLRPVCGAPAPGRASCMAVELVPRTAAARARTHPLGMALVRGKQAASPAAGGAYGLRPQDLHGAYELPDSAPTAQTIALIDAYNDPTAEADLRVYSEEFGLPACTAANHCFSKLNEEGNSSPLPETEGSWSVEISLDIETAHAVCESCHIMLVEANSAFTSDLDAAVQSAVSAGADEISNSYGGDGGESGAYDHPGVVITASTGDWGYDNWSDRSLAEAANFPAASPNVVAVGGTELFVADEAWSAESAWDEGGSGCGEAPSPSWQQAVSDWSEVGCGSRRAVADVSADADPYSGLAVYDTTPYPPYGSSSWKTIGGTSLSSPIIAATYALAGGAHGVEYPAETLYSHAGSADLHDILSGSNWGCRKLGSSGNPECSTAEYERNCSHQLICNAGAGYDGPTGVGSPHGIAAFLPGGGPAPVVTSVTPDEGAISGGGEVTIAGTGLAEASFVHFGGAAAKITADSSSSITVLAPEGSPGPVDVTVTGRGGIRSSETAADHYTYYVPKPSVTAVTPDEGPTVGGTTVQIKGSNLAGASYVEFGGTYAPVLSATEGTLTVHSPQHVAGVSDVVVYAPDGVRSEESSADRFTFVAPAPTVRSVSPASGTASGGTLVRITGTGLGTATAVHFGTATASIVAESEGSAEREEREEREEGEEREEREEGEEETESSVTVRSPEHEPGLTDILVTNPSGTSAVSPADHYLYTPPVPVITALTPDEGPLAGGGAVTITGADLGGATLVRFGSVAAAITSDSETAITATAPAEAAGTVAVTVTTPDATSATAGPADLYTYLGPLPIVGDPDLLTTPNPFGAAQASLPAGGEPRLGVLAFQALAFPHGATPTVRVTLSRPGTVVVSLTRLEAARRVHGRCLVRAERGSRCTLRVHVATLELSRGGRRRHPAPQTEQAPRARQLRREHVSHRRSLAGSDRPFHRPARRLPGGGFRRMVIAPGRRERVGFAAEVERQLRQ